AQGFYPDEREALFSNSLDPELYGDRLTAINVVAGAAFKIVPALSVGAGLSLAISNSVASTSYVRDPTNYDTLLLNNSIKTNVSVAPTIGALFVPISWLRVGAVVHSAQSFDIDTTVTAVLPSGTQSTSSRHDVFDWTPWSVGLGVET